ncbi:MAG: hypothetical protein Q8Q49_05740 [bacterium]|nr:hypothetical protein [bacterium]
MLTETVDPFLAGVMLDQARSLSRTPDAPEDTQTILDAPVSRAAQLSENAALAVEALTMTDPAEPLVMTEMTLGDTLIHLPKPVESPDDMVDALKILMALGEPTETDPDREPHPFQEDLASFAVAFGSALLNSEQIGEHIAPCIRAFDIGLTGGLLAKDSMGNLTHSGIFTQIENRLADQPHLQNQVHHLVTTLPTSA